MDEEAIFEDEVFGLLFCGALFAGVVVPGEQDLRLFWVEDVLDVGDRGYFSGVQLNNFSLIQTRYLPMMRITQLLPIQQLIQKSLNKMLLIPTQIPRNLHNSRRHDRNLNFFHKLLHIFGNFYTITSDYGISCSPLIRFILWFFLLNITSIERIKQIVAQLQRNR